jgi:hypothetical protein
MRSVTTKVSAGPLYRVIVTERSTTRFVSVGSASAQGMTMSSRTILIVVLLLLLLGALPTWPYSSGWGYYPSGGLGLILLIIIVLALF